MFKKWLKWDLYFVTKQSKTQRLFIQIINDKEKQKIFIFKKLEPSICDN